MHTLFKMLNGLSITNIELVILAMKKVLLVDVIIYSLYTESEKMDVHA